MPEGSSDRVVLRRDGLFRRSLALADMLSAVAALTAVALVGRGELRLMPAALVLLPLVVAVNKATGLYDRDQYLLRKSTMDETPQLLHLAVLFGLAVWLGEGLFVGGQITRAQVVLLMAVMLVASLLGRTLARAWALSITPPERCVVLGNADAASRLAEKLSGSSAVHADIIGRIALDDRDALDGPGGPPRLGHVGSLAVTIAEYEVERVVMAPDGHDQETILAAVRLIKALGVKVSVLPRLFEVVGSSSAFDDVDGITLLGVRQYGLTNSSDLLKRLMDVLGSAVALLVLAPLFAVLAIAIKADTPGPVFFSQRRIGRAGRDFGMLKFRSMVHGADAMKDDLRRHNEAEGLFKISNDPRITRVGRFLRSTSLDELPQLWNVLRGDMALVGPRPLVPDEDALIEGWERRRLVLRPGMTGLWQIFGSARIPMHEMVKIDYMYGANWSLWLDLKVLFRTIPYVFSRRGQ